MKNFELLLIFFIPVRKGLFCEAYYVNLYLVSFRSKHICMLSGYEHVLSLLNSK